VVVVVELGGLFIAKERRWSGGAPVVAGRRPLMALRASRSGMTRDSRRRRDISGSGTVCRRKASTWRGPRGAVLGSSSDAAALFEQCTRRAARRGR